MSEDLELQVEKGLERLAQVASRMEALKAWLSTGAPLATLQPPPEWSVLRERIMRLTANNEATRDLAEQAAKLAINTSQRVTKPEEQNSKQ